MTAFTLPSVKQGELSLFGINYDWPNGGITPSGYYYCRSKALYGQNFSESHKMSRDGKYRSGGAWLMDKKEVSFESEGCTMYRPTAGRAYEGGFKADDGVGLYSVYVSPSTSQEEHLNNVRTYGAQAYAALRPDYPDFSPAASLYELRDTPASLLHRFKTMRRKVKKAQKARISRRKFIKRSLAEYRARRYGSYYLMVKFGWLPLFKDICDFTQAFKNRERRYQQMLRDAGRPVRRRRRISHSGNSKDAGDAPVKYNSVVHSTTYNTKMQPIQVTQCYPNGLPGATSENQAWADTEIWCEGQSRYWLPPGPHDAAFKAEMMQRILGMRLSPDAVYNMIPWSWLADYFTTLGSFVKAISPGIADRYVFDYAYLMHSMKHTYDLVCTQWVFTNKAGTKTERITARKSTVWSRKTRIVASPVGWGLRKEDLSPFQAAALAALAV